jgi:hypothetical protein
MAEALVSIKEASRRLGISIRSFHRHRKKLIAVGLQIVRLGQRVTVRERSIDSVIEYAAEREQPLYEIDEK